MNAASRVFVDLISAWPRTLPWPQIESVQINWDKPSDDIGTLQGPTRFRLAHPNASPSYEFEILFTENECELFEAWYNKVVDLGGEMYLPWIGEGRIVYFTEYELAPLGTGWRLHALAVQLYVDPDYCDRHVCDAAHVWRVIVIVDADENFPIILCELPGVYLRPRLIDRFFGKQANARLTDPWDTPNTFIASLGSTNNWIGNTWGHDNNPGLLVELKDTITAYLPATSLNYPIFIDIPANWMWDDQVEQWFTDAKMVYVDDWDTLYMEARVNACRLLKDILPPPWRMVIDSDWNLTRIIADMFPLEVYTTC